MTMLPCFTRIMTRHQKTFVSETLPTFLMVYIIETSQRKVLSPIEDHTTVPGSRTSETVTAVVFL